MSDDEQTPLERLTAAAQAFANALAEEPVMLRGAVLVWEQVRFEDDGRLMYRVDYASLADTSPSETIGLLELTRVKAIRDMGGFRKDDDDGA